MSSTAPGGTAPVPGMSASGFPAANGSNAGAYNTATDTDAPRFPPLRTVQNQMMEGADGSNTNLKINSKYHMQKF